MWVVACPVRELTLLPLPPWSTDMPWAPWSAPLTRRAMWASLGGDVEHHHPPLLPPPPPTPPTPPKGVWLGRHRHPAACGRRRRGSCQHVGWRWRRRRASALPGGGCGPAAGAPGGHVHVRRGAADPQPAHPAGGWVGGWEAVVPAAVCVWARWGGVGWGRPGGWGGGGRGCCRWRNCCLPCPA